MITLIDSAADSPQIISLSGIGVGPPPTVSLSPDSVAFPGQTVGTSSPPQIVMVTNNGNVAVTIASITLGGANSAEFGMSQTCGVSLAAGAECQISVTFTPAARGNFTGTITLMDNAANSPQTISLTGTGTSPTADLAPGSLTFPGQFVGTTGLPQNITLTNNGNVALTISSVQASAQFGTTNGCTNSLAAAGSCTLSVFFDPSSSGTQTGTLTVTDNATGSPQTIPLSGAGMDFGLSSSAVSASVSPGQTANYTLTVSPLGGLNRTVNLTCTGAPSLSTCTVSPSAAALNGTASAPVTVSVSTMAGSRAPPCGNHWPPLFPGPGRLLNALLMLVGLVALTAMRKRRASYLLVASLALMMLWAACGGGGGPLVQQTAGTPAGTYELTVTGTVAGGSSASLTHTVKLNLTVN